MSSATKEHILLLFDRPHDPVFVPKGPKKTVLKVRKKFLDTSNGLMADFLETINAGEVVDIKDIPLPDLGEITSIGRNENFSLFIPLHCRLAANLTNILYGFDDLEDFLAVCCYARENVNPYLFNYSLSVCLLNRKDTRDMPIPSLIYSFPHKYFKNSIFEQAREEVTVVPERYREPIVIPNDYTASDYDEEHRLAYFREDLGVNLHHWHWHLVYPINGPDKVVNKDRRGELFYYMHQQMLSRYNFERLCNHLRRVEQLDDLKEPIKEAYFPKLESVVSSSSYQGRAAYLKFSDLDRPNIRQNLSDMIRWRERIFEAIHTGKIRLANGQQVDLNENEGIDILGNIVEATTLSRNANFYGNYHNMGHNFIALINDPQYKYLESSGVMGDSTTAMRDPVFYRWHAHINNIFQEFKSTIPSYSIEQLAYEGVTVTNIEVQSEGSPTNRLNTFWQQSEIDLRGGLDSQGDGSLLVKFTHLQHQPFCYRIIVNNQGDYRKGTCRIFLAPKFQENGKAFSFEDQRHMFIELDKFEINLEPGQNGIRRSSTHSSVTIPFEKTFNNAKPGDGAAQEEFNNCGCGWPQHMLIPKGKPEGFLCQLFVMISNYNDDFVKQDTTGTCHDAFSYCGIKDSLYPDRRSMGYPFDRTPRTGVDNLQQFLTENMGVQDIVIQFSNETMGPVNATMQEE